MIIFLNGTSSSGKSSIAQALRSQLKEPYFLFAVDSFLEQSLPLNSHFESEADFKLVLESVSGFNGALKPISEAVEYMIVDHVLQFPAWFKEVKEALKDKPVLWVHVTAPLQIIEAREELRNDRQAGTARSQYETISGYPYDLEIDTSKLSPEEGAHHIAQALIPQTTISNSQI